MAKEETHLESSPIELDSQAEAFEFSGLVTRHFNDNQLEWSNPETHIPDRFEILSVLLKLQKDYVEDPGTYSTGGLRIKRNSFGEIRFEVYY